MRQRLLAFAIVGVIAASGGCAPSPPPAAPDVASAGAAVMAWTNETGDLLQNIRPVAS